jgi:hypothetical protein|tara:strand:+ start:5710 stop:6033 length:324 start_codon:yes stop_codon:yes gene_type:complete
MTCRRCNEKDDFCDGNSSEELCKHCLDHCCEDCFKELETKEEYEHSVCNECYVPFCDYCGEEGEIVLHHGDNCCKKCLSYEDNEYCNCKGCGRLIERNTECKDCKKK